METREDSFGTYRLTGWRGALHEFAMAMPGDWIGKHARSMLRRAALLGSDKVVDVDIFNTAHMRLYPQDNITDKHLFANPRMWDGDERKALAAAISEFGDDHTIRFVDVGANIGGYTIAALCEAERQGRDMRVLAIEPVEFCRDRLIFNLQSSRLMDKTVILGSAIGPESMDWQLLRTPHNLGETHLVQSDNIDDQIMVSKLSDVVRQSDFSPPDIVKIDIEGLESIVLHDYFKETASEDLPKLIIAETRAGKGLEIAKLCVSVGYECLFDNSRNGVYKRTRP